jgi:hypothetical protein
MPTMSVPILLVLFINMIIYLVLPVTNPLLPEPWEEMEN